MIEPPTPACPTCGNAHGVAGVVVRGVYDGVLYWECAECGTRGHRHEKGTRLRKRAEDYLDLLANRPRR